MLEQFVEQAYKNLGNNVYRFRVLEQLSQAKLAEKAHVSSSYISQIECFHLHKGITCTAMVKIAETLKVPLCVLFAEEPCQKYLECLERITSSINKIR